MSDVFTGKVFISDNKSLHLEDSKECFADFDDIDQAIYAENAINNHDRLVEENEKLKAALQEIAEWNSLTLKFKCDYGSNGQRDYYRNVAIKALGFNNE